MGSMHNLASPVGINAASKEVNSDHYNSMSISSTLSTGHSSANAFSTPVTAASSPAVDADERFQDLKRYIALGCLHSNIAVLVSVGPTLEEEWSELLFPDLPDEVKLIIGADATRLLDARWIRLFLHQKDSIKESSYSLIRVYLLPEDWGRRTVDRSSKSLKAALRQVLHQIDTSPCAWLGNYREAGKQYFDPWATPIKSSLYYLFNKLPSPAPDPQLIRSRYTRASVRDLLNSAAHSEWEEHGEQPLAGLRTRLYPYQARSASLMIQREAAPQLQLDPRLEMRKSPNGETFYFGARDGSFLQDPPYYEASRGGILAETMGLGKTIICLAVILTTKGHYPRIPAAYFALPPIRNHVGSLSDMAASTIGRYSIPAKALIEQSELNGETQFSHLKAALQRNLQVYEIPPDLPRMNRTTIVPPPRQLLLCSGTIIVVPRNLLHQWQSEIRKHVLKDGLKILILDSINKRGPKAKAIPQENDALEFASEIPIPSKLMEFDVVLFTRNRFEQEIVSVDEQKSRQVQGASRCCCPCIGATRIRDCNCVDTGATYESPLKKFRWLRIIIDEGHSFSSSVSNAVLLAKQIEAERRWVVSGTPAKNLVGVEVDATTLETDDSDVHALRESIIEQQKSFNHNDEGIKATKALGALASNFLMVRPWCDSSTEGKLEWDEYVYRHEHQYRKTYSGYSSCFLRTLEGLVVKTRPEDVEKDIVLPPMRHRVVYLKPCWFDKMTANLFIQVLRSNAVTSERADVDYLFHKNSVKARHSLIKNLRQSNFTWTGFRLEDVINTLETTTKYLAKEDRKCSPEDESSLLESSRLVSNLTTSESWLALSKAHEVGMAIENWPAESEPSFSLAYPMKPTIVGITQLLDGQLHVDSHIVSQNPAHGLEPVGLAAKARIEAMAQAEDGNNKEEKASDSQLTKPGVPSSCVETHEPLTSRRAPALGSKALPLKLKKNDKEDDPSEPIPPTSPAIRKKRKLTLAEEQAELPADSPLLDTKVIGTTSAKLTYLLDKVVQHQATEKIIIFYDGDNAAFYIAQCLEMLYINHRIYARTLDNTKRSEYVALFNRDPDIRVLLIDVACGALGLNLNAASIVLIVNPINRPGIEAQAIKRAHRIGQTKPVSVETLILEDTIEHAIFNHAKKMSRTQHLEAKELEDDEGIIKIIQDAQVLPVMPGDEAGNAMFAKLQTPQQVFGRPNRHKFHRYGIANADSPEKPRKKAKKIGKVNQTSNKTESRGAKELSVQGVNAPAGAITNLSVLSTGHGEPSNPDPENDTVNSIFGNG